MTVLSPDHLLQQAERLAARPPAGVSRQVDLRRAISSAYYGLFHFTLTCLADEFVGVMQRATSRYALVYRSVDHRVLKDLCLEIQRPTPSRKFVPYFPAGGFGPELGSFAASAFELYEKRNRADYDPGPRFRSLDAQLAITTARDALERFGQAKLDIRRVFLTLLLCPPR